MKVYIDENDIDRNIVTYHDGANTQQGLYVYGKDKIEVLSLADYTKQVRKEVCDKVRERFKEIIFDNSTIDEILDQIEKGEN